MNKISIIKKLSIIFVKILLILSFYNVAIADEDNELKLLKNFSDDLTFKIRSILTDASISPSTRDAQIKQIFFKYMDSDLISGFSLGRAKRNLSANKFNEFKGVFTIYLANTFVDTLKKFTSAEFIIDSVSKTNEVGNYRVKSRIIMNPVKNSNNNKNDSNTLIVEYRVLNKKLVSGTSKISNTQDFMIYDMIVGGISMAMTQRAEINSQLSTSDNIDQVINNLDNLNKNFARKRA